MKLIPFDLKLAQAGHPIQTRDGRPAKFIAHVPEAGEPFRVLALAEGEICATAHHEDGRAGEIHCQYDLFMAPVTHERWVNIYPDDVVSINPSKEQADHRADPYRIACIKITYTEGEGL